MREALESFKAAGKTVSIFIDDEPVNPRRDYDHLSTMVCWHPRRNLGDEQNRHAITEEEIRESLGDELLALLPLYIYEHSGTMMSTSPFSCRFDSGMVGWAYVTKASAKDMGCVGDRFTYENGTPTKVGTWDEEALQENIRGEVEEYNHYLSGECYGFEVTGRDGEHLESCWGFLGNLDYVRREAKTAAEYAIDPAVERDAEALTREVDAMTARATYAGVA